jgi:hypothetical protein
VGMWMERQTAAVILVAACAAAAGCGDVVRQGRAPVQLVINSLEAAPGAEPDEFGASLLSDVITVVQRTVNSQEADVPTVFNDLGEVTMSLILKDPGQPGTTAAPSAINQVTITRYRVIYRRSDGRNTPGIDVPFPFDSAATFTVPAQGTVTAGFQLVRHTAKQEAPLATLAFNPDVISTLAEVTFFGRDQAGNDISATGMIGVDFGNFADPE